MSHSNDNRNNPSLKDSYSVNSLKYPSSLDAVYYICPVWFPSCRSLQTLKSWSRGFITFSLSGWRPISSLKSKFGYARLHCYCYFLQGSIFLMSRHRDMLHTAHCWCFCCFQRARGVLEDRAPLWLRPLQAAGPRDNSGLRWHLQWSAADQGEAAPRLRQARPFWAHRKAAEQREAKTWAGR